MKSRKQPSKMRKERGEKDPFQAPAGAAVARRLQVQSMLHNQYIIVLLMAVLFAGGVFRLSVYADQEHSDYAGESEQILNKVVKYGMVPIRGQDVKDGTYNIEVSSSSSFFRINTAKLYVKNGQMTADLILSSQSYLLVYMGTGEEASKAPASDYITFKKDKEGHCVFTVPVSGLNEGINCAAFSKRRTKWYDRKLVFEAASLPEGTISIDLPDYDKIEKAIDYYDSHQGEEGFKDGEAEGGSSASKTGDSGTGNSGQDAMSPAEAMKINKEDGEYSIEVNMTGGSGRASISSPTLFIVKDGKAYARLIWSSSYYDYMIVAGKKYINETTDGGNSTFTIPVTKMDRIMPVKADTTAMGDPVEIDYSLTFYQNTIGGKGLIPQEAAKKVLIFALIIIVAGAVLNHVVKKRRKGQ